MLQVNPRHKFIDVKLPHIRHGWLKKPNIRQIIVYEPIKKQEHD